LIDRFRPVLTGNDALVQITLLVRIACPVPQFTFNDLVPLAVEILDRSEMAKNAVRQTYSDVFLDEFQDCTRQQYEVNQLVVSGSCRFRLFAVGDNQQRSWVGAGALEVFFVAFAKDFNASP